MTERTMGVKLYALAIQAQLCIAQGVKVVGNTGSCVAGDHDEAIGKAYTSAQQEWPVEDGWYSHAASVCEIPQRQILEVMGMTDFADEFNQAREEASKEIDERAEEMRDESADEVEEVVSEGEEDDT